MVLVIITMISGCGGKQRYEAQYLDVFDTYTQIIAYTNSQKEFEEYSEYIHDELLEYHKLFDIYNDYEGINNIKTINDNAGIQPVKVDSKIIDLLKFSKEEYVITNENVNIAMGSVLKIWHDYRTKGTEDPDNAQLPDFNELENASMHMDIDKIIIDTEDNTVFIEDSEMSIDVGAIAKGYAVEQISSDVKAKGLENALISVGGNVFAIGGKGDSNESWNVGVQNPDENSDESNVCITAIKDVSLVTSGDYQRYYTVDGVKYHHIINQQTLMPSDYFSSVTIICTDSAEADALSTAVFNMPFEEGEEFINSLENAEALWVFKNGEVKYSADFEKYIKQ